MAKQKQFRPKKGEIKSYASFFKPLDLNRPAHIDDGIRKKPKPTKEKSNGRQ